MIRALGHALLGLGLATCASCGALSAPPRGDVLVFASSRSGEGDLWAMTGGTPRLLFGTSVPEGTPRLDRARGRIVVQRFSPVDETAPALLVAWTPGGDEPERPLFVNPAGDAAPVWSPDGSSIAFTTTHESGEDLFVADADGRNARALTFDAEPDRYPAWAPDGRRLAFARRDASGWDLFTIEVDVPNARPRRLTRDGRLVGHPSWSPDGRWVAFDARFEDHTDIATCEVATGTVRRLTELPGNEFVPVFSSDGRRLAFGRFDPAEGNADVWELELETARLRRVTTEPGFDGAPLYVPRSWLEER